MKSVVTMLFSTCQKRYILFCIVPGCYHDLVHDICRWPTCHENDEEMPLTRISPAAAARKSWRQFVICRSLSSYHHHHHHHHHQRTDYRVQTRPDNAIRDVKVA